jgi:hypothetical protein
MTTKPDQTGNEEQAKAAGSAVSSAPRHGSGTLALDLEMLTYAGMVACSRVVRDLGEGAESAEQAAERIVRHFYDTFRVPRSGERACALVRCFQTHPYEKLTGFRRSAAEAGLRGHPAPEGMRCLTLLGTRGVEPEWCDAKKSEGHAAIPLPSAEVVQRAPMISRLILQMGIPVEHVLAPTTKADGLRLDDVSRSYDVFHVERARASLFIPAQANFVRRYGVRSVVGMGGLLPSGELFAIILFSRVKITREVAALFRTLALNVKLALLPFGPDQTFEAPQ